MNLREILAKTEISSKSQCVFLAACHSENHGKAFVDAGVPHVICMKKNTLVDDRTKQLFRNSFYRGIFQRK